jgi:hypothetical protein
MSGGHQIPFDFSGNSEDGFETWKREQREAEAKEAGKLGLPIGKDVEITLRCGQTLRGRLRYRERFAKTRRDRNSELEVDGVAFHRGEVASCVRADP